MAKRKNQTNSHSDVFAAAGPPTAPIYHNPTFGYSRPAPFSNWIPGDQSKVNMDEPLFAGGSGTSLRDVLNNNGHGSYHDAMPTYGGQSTRADPRTATKAFSITPNTPSTRQPMSASPRPRKSSGGGGAEMLEGAAMGMGMGRAARKGHFLEAVELAGLHEHEGNNQKVIDRWVNK